MFALTVYADRGNCGSQVGYKDVGVEAQGVARGHRAESLPSIIRLAVFTLSSMKGITIDLATSAIRLPPVYPDHQYILLKIIFSYGLPGPCLFHSLAWLFKAYPHSSAVLPLGQSGY